MKPVLYRYRDSESVIKQMEGYTPPEGWEPLYDKAALDAAVAAAQCVKPPRTEGCEIMTDREAFEAWAGKREKYHTTREWDAMRRAWQAATEAERERCAKVCDAIAHDWRGANSQSVQCANAIRKGE